VNMILIHITQMWRKDFRPRHSQVEAVGTTFAIAQRGWGCACVSARMKHGD
jgi:hypothetical protein